jgi:hypothetical protein
MIIKQKEKIITIDDSSLKTNDLKGNLDEIYQNSPEIASVIMQPGTKDKYISYGCRAIGLYRCMMYVLGTVYGEAPIFSINDFDKLIDDNHAWDNFDIVDVNKILPILQKLFSIDLKYFCKVQDKTDEFKVGIKALLLSDIPITIKMPSLVNIHSHFINAIGCKYSEKDLYLRMKETYKGYSGYDGFYINWDYIQCVEYFY